jgi:iron complex transport system substrate-binding protein
LIGAVLVTAYLGQTFLHHGTSDSPRQVRTGEDYFRIVSLSPSITEILYALGLGDRVAGVTRYCFYPEDAKTKPRIGGYYDLNYEAIIELKPDLIVMLTEHVEAEKYLNALGYETLTVNHDTIEQITDSIEAIGKITQRQREANRLIQKIESGIESVRSSVGEKAPRRVMIAVDRSRPDSVEQIYIAGNDGFFDSMIELAGGINAYQGTLPFPAVSVEGIVQMNPEVIIELVPQARQLDTPEEELLDDWNSLPEIDAIAKSQVYLLTADYVSIPGPRFVKTLQDIADLVHKETR